MSQEQNTDFTFWHNEGEEASERRSRGGRGRGGDTKEEERGVVANIHMLSSSRAAGRIHPYGRVRVDTLLRTQVPVLLAVYMGHVDVAFVSEHLWPKDDTLLEEKSKSIYLYF